MATAPGSKQTVAVPLASRCVSRQIVLQVKWCCCQRWVNHRSSSLTGIVGCLKMGEAKGGRAGASPMA